MSLEFVTTCDRRSSDSSTALIYWENLSSPSLLNVKSCVYLREKSRVHENDQDCSSRSHSLLSIRAKHRTTATARLYQQSIQRLRDTSQEQNRVIQYNHTLFSHRVHLSFITYFFAWWMAVIEQENTVFDITITSITSAKESSFVFAIEDRKSEHRCIEYHQWRAEQGRCVTTKSTGTH